MMPMGKAKQKSMNRFHEATEIIQTYGNQRYKRELLAHGNFVFPLFQIARLQKLDIITV